MTTWARRTFIIVAVAVVAGSVLGGLRLLGSPQEERERRLDERRIAEIQSIANAVDLYWTRQGRLPASLADLSQEQGIEVSVLDPATGRPYTYRVLGEGRYQLCAEFARDAGGQGRVPEAGFWAHGPGSQCFQLEPKAVER